MPSQREDQDNLQSFQERYSRRRGPGTRQLEETVFGQELGVIGYTTVQQAVELSRTLGLTERSRLLEVGAGQGWPGWYIAQSLGCGLVSTDVPLEALREARSSSIARGHQKRQSVVGADAQMLPFRSESFEAIVHADVF